MTRSRLILLLSLAGNVGLVALLLWIHSADRLAQVEAGSPARLPDRRATDSPDALRSSASRAAGSEQVDTNSRGNTWAELRTEDLPTMVARLRNAGFPPYILRAIVSSLVSERFAAQRERLLTPEEDVPYWKQTPNALGDPEKMAALNQLSRERSLLLKQLLGENKATVDELARVYQIRRYGDLAPEKMERLQTLLADYSDLRMQVRPITPEDVQKSAALEKEFRADLARLLTPAELEQYDLRASATATQLRYRLDAFAASESEYRAIFQLQRSIDEQFPAGLPQNPAQVAARRAAEAQIQSQLKAALGPERHADYQQATNPNYSSLNQLVSRFELPISTARDVVAVQQSIQSRAQAVLTSDTLTDAQQRTQLHALAQEAMTRLGATLPPSALQAYQQRGGEWLQALTRNGP